MLGLPPCTDKQYPDSSNLEVLAYFSWIISLLLALISALLGMFHKFWLSRYQGRTTAGADHARYWAIRHLFFSAGLHTNHVRDTMNIQEVVLASAVVSFTMGFFASVADASPILVLFLLVLTIAIAVSLMLLRNSLRTPALSSAAGSLHMHAEDPTISARIVADSKGAKVLMGGAVRRLLEYTANDKARLAVLHTVCALHPLSRAAWELAKAARRHFTPTRFFTLSMAVTSTPDDIARTIKTYVVIWGGEFRLGLGAGLPSSAGEVLQASERPELSLLGAAMNMDLAHIRKHAVDWRQRTPYLDTFVETSLLLTRLRGVSISAVLHFLLCVKFSVVMEDDWTSIFTRFRTLLARAPPRLGGHAQRLSEILAELVSGRTLCAEDSDVAETLISNLLEESKLWPKTAAPHISPFLVAYIAATGWLERSCSPSALRTLTDILTRWEDWAMFTPSTATTAFRAMTNVVSGAIRAQGMGEDGRTHIVTPVARAVASLLEGDANVSPASVLGHIDAPPGEPANLLQMLFALDPGNCLLPRLVEVLAAALPSRSRSEESQYDDAPVETFFNSVSFADILRTLFEKGRKQYDSSAYAQFKHIAQHCIELKPTWWSTFLRATDVQGDSDIELREFVLEMGVEVDRLGPCTIHGPRNAPVDWNAPCFKQE